MEQREAAWVEYCKSKKWSPEESDDALDNLVKRNFLAGYDAAAHRIGELENALRLLLNAKSGDALKYARATGKHVLGDPLSDEDVVKLARVCGVDLAALGQAADRFVTPDGDTMCECEAG